MVREPRFAPLVGIGYVARRYLHKVNKAAEQKMLQHRERQIYFGHEPAYGQWDTEALYCSLMMLDSWEKERVKIEEEEE